ncbi:MAG: PLP-dependent transferase [Fuerstiella sp.]
MPADILNSPRSQADQLGLPIPDDTHAVSVCLPTWSDIIGYEEKHDQVIDRLKAAYPRFGFHPLIKQLCRDFIDFDGQQGLPFASAETAERAVRYCQERAGVTASASLITSSPSEFHAVTVAKSDFDTLKEYWQHAGENLSSRAIEGLLAGQAVTCSETKSRTVVRGRVADIQQTAADNVLLYPSGMAAIATAFRTVQAVRPGPTCQFGFPYVDTLKVQQKFAPAECLFLPLGNANDLQKLDIACQTSNISAVFCEVPTNPLLVTPDLKQLRQLADRHNFLLIIDDTLTACGNIHTLPFSDITVTSLTKYFSGEGNVLAGSLTVNPNGKFANDVHQHFSKTFEESLCDHDVEVLEANSSNLQQRIRTTNETSLQLANFLKQHELVEQVFYPSAEDPIYRGLQNANSGCGGLMSIVLRNPTRSTPHFYDNLKVNKGPNLGTRFTLCCPFTMLAHYNELDFAESCGVSRWLLRISVGLESADDLIGRFQDAFESLTDSESQ